MFTLKRRLIPRQRAQVPLALNKKIPLRRDISKDLSCNLMQNSKNLIAAITSCAICNVSIVASLKWKKNILTTYKT